MVLMATKWDDQDWFRSSTWSPEIAEAFEARLKRARAWNHAQYLRIQGVHLAAQNDEALRGVGRDLFRRVVDDYGDNDHFEALTALENLGDSLAAEGMDGPAEIAYREVLTRVAASPTGRSGTSHTTELSLAELLLTRGDDATLEEADGMLDIAEEQVGESAMFRNLVLRYLVARARVAARRGNQTGAIAYAREALSVADETEPAIPRHPTLGQPDVPPELRAELRALVQGSAPATRRKR